MIEFIQAILADEGSRNLVVLVFGVLPFSYVSGTWFYNFVNPPQAQ